MAWMCNVLKRFHIMFAAYEEHDAIIPPAVPKPLSWHINAPTPLCLGPWGALTGKPVPNVKSSTWADTLQRGSDIGPLIVHFSPTAPPNYLYPVILLTSASKSEFGVANTQAGGEIVAVAIVCVVNLNLNCWSMPRPPLPSGIVITWNSVAVGATLLDLAMGALCMLIDGAMQWGLNKLFANAPFAKWMDRWAGRLFGNLLIQSFESSGSVFASRFLYQMGSSLIDNAIPTVLSVLLGGPMGISAVNLPQKAFPNLSDWLSPGGAAPGSVISNIPDAIQKHFDNPNIDEHPSQPQ
jgi:hypothetical protein